LRSLLRDVFWVKVSVEFSRHGMKIISYLRGLRVLLVVHFYFCFTLFAPFGRMSYSGVSPNDRDGHTSMATLGELFIPSDLWGWDCCASVDCVLCQGLENLQLVDHAA